jgi:hypothetical protein
LQFTEETKLAIKKQASQKSRVGIGSAFLMSIFTMPQNKTMANRTPVRNLGQTSLLKNKLGSSEENSRYCLIGSVFHFIRPVPRSLGSKTTNYIEFWAHLSLKPVNNLLPFSDTQLISLSIWSAKRAITPNIR